MSNRDRGEIILSAIYDDVDHRLNPNDEACWHCGGEGLIYDCIDGCCEDAESGCDDCSRTCPECIIYTDQRAKAVREQVIASGDTDVAIAWLKEIGRWHDGITPDQVTAELSAARLSKGEQQS